MSLSPVFVLSICSLQTILCASTYINCLAKLTLLTLSSHLPIINTHNGHQIITHNYHLPRLSRNRLLRLVPLRHKTGGRPRFSNIPYRTEQGSIPKAPRGKVPYVSIQIGEQPPQTLADSTLITKALIEQGYVEDLNQRLSPTERMHDLALKALLEDKLYPYQVRVKSLRTTVTKLS